ncbi:MAG TPA: nitrilase-related carbon-nitrogen hydrolase [Actinomycetota bacterium]|nr:nitrilase-related carbon-nitrogen hydrolase [Actinomycetota bacterium]
MAFRALALQTTCRSLVGVSDVDEARAAIRAAIERIGSQVAGSLAFIGPDCRLVVLPEYVLTGHPLGEPIEVWAERAAIAPDGPEYETLGEIARGHGVYLAGNAYETDPHFPGWYFQASFVISPGGEVVLRYRRLNSMFSPTPHDVLDRYLEHYDDLFPVARTEIGTLACIASEEILFPEVARCLAMKGAEVFLHSTSEIGSPLPTQKDVAKRARAIENLAYVVSANTAGIEGSPIPAGSTDGKSQVVDFEGRVLVEAGPGESMVANATIELDALRAARRRPGMQNLLARNRFDLYAPEYARGSFHEANGLAGAEPDRAYFMRAQRQVIDRLVERGVIG